MIILIRAQTIAIKPQQQQHSTAALNTQQLQSARPNTNLSHPNPSYLNSSLDSRLSPLSSIMLSSLPRPRMPVAPPRSTILLRNRSMKAAVLADTWDWGWGWEAREPAVEGRSSRARAATARASQPGRADPGCFCRCDCRVAEVSRGPALPPPAPALEGRPGGLGGNPWARVLLLWRLYWDRGECIRLSVLREASSASPSRSRRPRCLPVLSPALGRAPIFPAMGSLPRPLPPWLWESEWFEEESEWWLK